jgi:hypothetical protein
MLFVRVCVQSAAVAASVRSTTIVIKQLASVHVLPTLTVVNVTDVNVASSDFQAVVRANAVDVLTTATNMAAVCSVVTTLAVLIVNGVCGKS